MMGVQNLSLSLTLGFQTREEKAALLGAGVLHSGQA